MKTFEIDYTAPVAILRKSRIDRYRFANIYKVKYNAAFLIHIVGTKDTLFGDTEQVINYTINHGLKLDPMNAKGRKFFQSI